MIRQTHLLLTRPLRQSERFARQCRKRMGDAVKIVISPLITIKTIPPAAGPGDARHFLFTSENGVRAAAQVWPDHRPVCFAVGDRTAGVARDLGYDARSCGGTVDSMIARLVADRPDGPYLHLRGQHTKGALARHLNDAGLETREAVIYHQNATDLNKEAENILCGDMPVLVPLFSPRSATIFWTGRQSVGPKVTIVAMSDAVAKECAGYGAEIIIAEKPSADAMLDCISAVVAATNDN